MFLRVGRKDEKETRHKHAPIAEGPLPVLGVLNAAKTVFIKRPDEYVENVSRSRVALPPKSPEDSHNDKEIFSIPVRGIIRNYHAEEEKNLKHATSIPSKLEEPRGKHARQFQRYSLADKPRTEDFKRQSYTTQERQRSN